MVWPPALDTSLVIPDGWTGTWDVTETVVKTFAMYRRAGGDPHPPTNTTQEESVSRPT